jgi:hypothetical protein
MAADHGLDAGLFCPPLDQMIGRSAGPAALKVRATRSDPDGSRRMGARVQFPVPPADETDMTVQSVRYRHVKEVKEMPYPEKQVSEKITRTTEAWEEHAGDAKFAEMTLDQFKAKVKPSLDCREKIASLRRQLEPAIKKRQECDAASTDICTKVVNAVRGDIEHGEDSALFKALGYVPKSERKSGLRRMATLKKAA